MIAIDLRSDTVTQPTPAMRRVMAKAEVGDDCFGDDLSTHMLEEVCAALFGKEAALFMASGTMSNQVALRALTSPGDEVITEERYHINYFESAQSSDLARVVLNICHCPDGILRPRDVAERIASKPRGRLYAQPKLVTVENTINVVGGKVFPLANLKDLADYAHSGGLAVHLDGGRIFNACVASGVEPEEYAKLCDTVSACFSKGLGAPFGSILCGSREVIEKARRYRKWYGGALHQSGIMAAAALHALEHNLSRLAIDHDNAQLMARLLRELPGISLLFEPVETNMVYFDVSALGMDAEEFCRRSAQAGVLFFPWGQETVRAATHLGIFEADIYEMYYRLESLCAGFLEHKAA